MMNTQNESDDKFQMAEQVPKISLHILISYARTSKWFVLGVLLQLDIQKLNDIKKKNEDEEEKLLQMYELWLSSKPNATYEDLIKALESKPLEEITVADELRQSYLQANDESHMNVTKGKMQEADATVNDSQDSQFIDFATKLQKEYRSLLMHAQQKMQATFTADATKALKSVLKSLLKQKSTFGCNAELECYNSAINIASSINDLFSFLVDKNFIGYLNPAVLSEIIDLSNDDDLKQKKKQYMEKYKELIFQPNFEMLINVFTSDKNLQPSSIVGLPSFVVFLSNEWNKRSMKHLKEYLPFIEECKPQLDSIGLECVIITFSVFPKYFEKLMSYLTNAKFTANCKDNGIEFELSGLKNCLQTVQPSASESDESRELPFDFQTKKKGLEINVFDAIKMATCSIQPALLTMAGLPNSGVTSTFEEILKNSVGTLTLDGIRDDKDKPPTYSQVIVSGLKLQMSQIEYAKVASDDNVAAYIHVIAAGLLEYYSSTRHVEITQLQFNKDYEERFNKAEAVFSVLEKVTKLGNSLSSNSHAALPFESSLVNGLGLVNIWDFTVDKATYNFLHFFSGHFLNSFMWLFMDLWRDQKLHIQPEPLDDGKSATSGTADMVWRSRLHYLLRLCKMCQVVDFKRNKACQAFAMHKKDEDYKSSITVEQAKEKIANVFKYAVGVVGVEDVFDGSITPTQLDSDSKMKEFVVRFKYLLRNQVPKQIPLWWVFLRLLIDLNLTDDMFYARGNLVALAKDINNGDDNFVDHFCRFFTSFGSIFDIHLINDGSNTIIAQPLKFLKTLWGFYYNDDRSEEMHKYGIVHNEQIGKLVTKGDKFIHALVEIGLAIEVKHDQLCIDIAPNHDRSTVYYMPSVRDGKPEVQLKKSAVQLVLDSTSPLINIEVALIKKLLASVKGFKLQRCETVNITKLVFTKDEFSSDKSTVTLTSQGDALEMYLEPASDDHLRCICSEIVVSVKDIAANTKPTFKYHYGVVCAEDGLKKHAYNVYHRRHNLPTTYFCSKCMEAGYYKRKFINAWNSALEENQLFREIFFVDDLDDSNVNSIAATLSSLGDKGLVEVFLGELGYYNVKQEQVLMPEYIANKIKLWKSRDRESNEGVSPRKVISRKLLKVYAMYAKLKKKDGMNAKLKKKDGTNAKLKKEDYDKIKELARQLDFQVFTSDQLSEVQPDSEREVEGQPQLCNLSAIEEILPLLIEERPVVLDTDKLINAKDKEFLVKCTPISESQKEEASSQRTKHIEISVNPASNTQPSLDLC